MKAAGKVAAMLVPVLLLVIAVKVFAHDGHSMAMVPHARRDRPAPGVSGAAAAAVRSVAGAAASMPGRCGSGAPKPPLIGLAPSTPWQAGVARFEKVTRVRPQLVVSYVPFGSPFDPERACQVARSGALLMIQMNPRHAGLGAIAAGRYDSYLNRYAKAVRALDVPLVYSFAHEMNGPWFPWGYRHTAPATFIAAWRHIHRVFARAGARNVIWCWNVNRNGYIPGAVSPARWWWPGRRYVDWVGVDAYFMRPADTFATVFGTTFADIRQFTRKPILITETAVPPGPQQTAQIASLFAGIRLSQGIIGFVWFDTNGRARWHLEPRPSGVAAFRRGVRLQRAR